MIAFWRKWKEGLGPCDRFESNADRNLKPDIMISGYMN